MVTPTVNPAAMLAEFHDALGQPYGHGNIADSTLRIKLHREETKELIEALRDGDRVAIAQELADVVYVAYGTAHSLGLELDVPLEPSYPARDAAARFTGETLGLILALLGQVREDAATSLAELVADAYFTAHGLGIPLDAVLAEVHRANMTKFGPDGPILRFDGKILKPDGWTPPDVAGVLNT
jgi:predicted HAD superfamily Cof-like phosphohydrolase